MVGTNKDKQKDKKTDGKLLEIQGITPSHKQFGEYSTLESAEASIPLWVRGQKCKVKAVIVKIEMKINKKAKLSITKC